MSDPAAPAAGRASAGGVSYAIRRAAAADAPAIAALRLEFARIVKNSGAGPSGAAAARLARDLESRIVRRMASGASVFLIAEPGDIAGAGEISFREASRGAESAGGARGDACGGTPKRAEILNIHILPEFRRIGIGTAILRAMIAECAARGVKKIVLQPTEDGRTIYARAGFTAARAGTMALYL